MRNILKTQNKFSLKKSIFLVVVLCFSFSVNAQNSRRSAQSSSRKNQKTSGQVRRTAPSSSNTSVEKNSNTKSVSDIDVSQVNKYNCETLYNKCMNQFCFSETNGRCSCNTTTNFNNANKNCEYITQACSSQANDIVEKYMRNAKSDCSSYTMASMSSEQTSLSSVLSNVIECLRPKCKANRNDEFAGCFDEDNFEAKLEMCKSEFENVSDLDTLKSMLNESMLTYKQKYCDSILGTMKSDGECYLTIGIGPSYKSIKKTKEFKIGDDVVCSENAFGTDLGESKHQKLRYYKEFALLGMNLIQSGLDIAAKYQDGKRDTADKSSLEVIDVKDNNNERVGHQLSVYEGSGTLKSSYSLADAGGDAVASLLSDPENTAMVIMGAIELSNADYSYSGACYVIKGDQVQKLFDADDNYYYKLRWTENWNKNMYAN